MDYKYEVTAITQNGETVTKTVEARNEFEAVQVANLFNDYLISVINLDI